MSVRCKIKLLSAPDRGYKPGDVVSGVFNYTIYEENVFRSITVTLKGTGKLNLYTNEKCNFEENYVNISHHVINNEETLPLGSKEERFSFILPSNIPPSLKCGKKITKDFEINGCNIEYNINIRFVRIGKRVDRIFKEIINVRTKPIPSSFNSRTVYEQSKYLAQFFSFGASLINIKAIIPNSIITPGTKAKFNLDITNYSETSIKGIQTKLIEVYTFNVNGSEGKNTEEISTVSNKITNGVDNNVIPIEIAVPSDVCTVEDVTSIHISRSYYIKIIVQLPLPHLDAVLKIPVKIGDIDQTEEHREELHSVDGLPSYYMLFEKKPMNYEFLPPSYFEVIGSLSPRRNSETETLP